MEVSCANDVTIYNLSAGKSVPDWLSERKRRSLQKNDIATRKRLELIQDFEMPGVCQSVQVTPDGQYILATGTYKPRLRCYDVSNLTMKFERCYDSEVIKFQILSEDYSKFVLLQCDRFLEFHAQYGRYYRVRIPKFGHDLAYHSPSCDLFICGASNEVFRLNLDQGKFQSPLITQASSINVCRLNAHNELLVLGTKEGHVEAWDPRSCTKVAVLDCALSSVTQDTQVEGMPSVTALSFKDNLTMAVGTATGQILLYDIRSNRPVLVKDHMNGFPIKDIAFHSEPDLVLSMDRKALKLWHRHNGKSFTYIEPSTNLNNLCKVPDSGMLFIAQEEQKILSYFIPSLGPAPKWCSVLDSLTEELEESQTATVYDDYKFVTGKEVDDLGLGHLIGSNLLRAYMHGYFLDIRLYHKAKAIVEPFAYDDYRKRKIREKIEEDRANRVPSKKTPKVNKDLAQKLQQIEESGNKKQHQRAATLLNDDRFKDIFVNPDFQVNRDSDEYRLLNPVVSKLDKSLKQKSKKEELLSQFENMEDDEEEEEDDDDSDDSSDDEHTWTAERKQIYKTIKYEAQMKRRQEDAELDSRRPKLYSLKDGEEFTGIANVTKNKSNKKMTLEERLILEKDSLDFQPKSGASGSREVTFKLKKGKFDRRREEAAKLHLKEREKVRRPATGGKNFFVKNKNF